MRKLVCEVCGVKQKVKENQLRIRAEDRKMYGPCAKCRETVPMHFSIQEIKGSSV